MATLPTPDYTDFILKLGGAISMATLVGVAIANKISNKIRPQKSIKTNKQTTHECRFNMNLEDVFMKMMDKMDRFEETLFSTKDTINQMNISIHELRHRLNWLEDKTNTIEAINPKTGEKLVLLVDDRADLMEGIAGLLRQNGFFVATATSYKGGFEELSTVKYDFAIIDASLSPNTFDGVQLAFACRRQFPHVKGILYSGYEIEQIPVGWKFVKKGDFKSILAAIKGPWDDVQ